MKSFPSVALQAPKILLPGPSISIEKWAVVACDQFTSQIQYWRDVEDYIGNAPSTYHMIMPEAYLGTVREKDHAAGVFPAMRSYLSQKIFSTNDAFILVNRTLNGKSRLGLMANLDLEAYDFNPSSQSLIRATEGTIIDRLPPRIAIREKADLELPHILVLIDDPGYSVIEPLLQKIDKHSKVYDFDLMKDGGHISGYPIPAGEYQSIVSALEKLKSPPVQSKKYHIKPETPPLLYAVGDGNHSLATAKAIWEKNKIHLPPDHLSRFALVELVNLHDEAILFEAIHRLLTLNNLDIKESCSQFFDNNITFKPCVDFSSLRSKIDDAKNNDQIFGLFNDEAYYAVVLERPKHTLTVGNIQEWLDHLLSEKLLNDIDYIHGADTIHELGTKAGHTGIYLPAMPKNALFRSVIKDGPLPRKTFSMGEASQKRYYLECREIK